MSITSPPGSPPRWPNTQTFLTSVSITTGLLYATKKTPSFLGLYFSARVASLVKALYDKRFDKAYFDVASIGSTLLFTSFPALSIGVDVVSEVFNYVKSGLPPDQPSESNTATRIMASLQEFQKNRQERADPNTPEGARKILDLTETDSLDSNKLTELYNKKREDLSKKQEKVAPLIAQQLGSMIADYEAAYQTLLKEIPNNCS